MSEETAVRIANSLEALVMITQQLLSNEPEPEEAGPLTVTTQEGQFTIGRSFAEGGPAPQLPYLVGE